MARRMDVIGARVLRSVLAATVGVAIGTLTATPGAAELPGCRMGDAITYKVMLSDVSLMSESGPSETLSEGMMELLYFAIQGKLWELQSLGIGTRARVVRCAGRRPQLDGADFVRPLVDELNINNVLLELWGKIREHRGDDSNQLDGWLAYYLIPIEIYEAGGSLNPLQHVRYQHGTDDVAVKFLSMFEDSIDFNAFALLTLGLKELKNGRYDDARASLCVARHLLLAQQGDNGATASDVPRLRSYVDGMLQTVVDEAQADNGYRGALKEMQEVLGDENACS